jgi:catechol 2,3-dioxygenase-like lactoylglutathione lyase family enzyme
MKRIGVVLVLFAAVVARAQTRPTITGIEYVRIYAADPVASRQFYTGRLGAAEVPSAHADSQQYQFGKNQYVEVVAGKGSETGMRVIAFRTADAEGLRRYLQNRKVVVPASLQVNADGSREFEVADTEGHRIVFIQPGRAVDKEDPLSHRIIHVGLIVKDRATMDHFYRDLLGFRLYWHGGMKDHDTDWVAMQVPEGTDWLEYMLNVDPKADHREVGEMNHFSLGLEDMSHAEAALKKSGWKPSEEQHKEIGRDGKWQLDIYDPDDVRVEFMEFKPAQKPCCSEFTGPHPKS